MFSHPPNSPLAGTDLARFLLPEDSSLLDAMKAIDGNTQEVVFAYGQHNRVSGLITDGDIRRGLIRGLGLEAPISEVMTRDFHRVGPEAQRTFVLDLMRAIQIRHVPVIGPDGSLQGIHFLRDFLGVKERSNVAVIMAGGKGVRLRPITRNLPKPLVQVAGRPILERLVLHLVSHGVRKIYLSINYLGSMIQEHFQDGSRFGCSIEYLVEDRELGTGGALALLPERPALPLLVMNGDLLTQADIGRLLDFHQGQEVKATLAVTGYRHVVPYGVADVKDGRLERLVEKPSLDFQVNSGIYVLDPSLIDMIEPGVDYPMTRLIDACLEKSLGVGVFPLEDEWRDIGSFNELFAARTGE